MKLQKRYKEQAATRVKVDQKNPSKKQKMVKVKAKQDMRPSENVFLLSFWPTNAQQKEAHTSKRIWLITAQKQTQTTKTFRCNGFLFYAAKLIQKVDIDDKLWTNNHYNWLNHKAAHKQGKIATTENHPTCQEDSPSLDG